MAKTNRFILDIGTTAFILGLVLVVFMGLGLAGNYRRNELIYVCMHNIGCGLLYGPSHHQRRSNF